MITHDDVLAHFQHELPPITLVSAYEDPALGLPNGGADVFIPDWHVLGPADAAQYPHSGFKQAEALEAFLFSLHRLKTAQHADGNEVRVWHMGDMVDEWRSLQPGDAGARIDGICGAFPNVFDLLTSSIPRGLGAEILAGNHDFQLFSLPQWRKARFRIVGDAAHGQMMVLHGDVFDWIEALPDDSAVRTCDCTSSTLMRPPGPLPFTRAMSTPSSRASRRTDGAAGAAGPAGVSSVGAGACGARAPRLMSTTSPRFGFETSSVCCASGSSARPLSRSSAPFLAAVDAAAGSRD